MTNKEHEVFVRELLSSKRLKIDFRHPEDEGYTKLALRCLRSKKANIALLGSCMSHWLLDRYIVDQDKDALSIFARRLSNTVWELGTSSSHLLVTSAMETRSRLFWITFEPTLSHVDGIYACADLLAACAGVDQKYFVRSEAILIHGQSAIKINKNEFYS